MRLYENQDFKLNQAIQLSEENVHRILHVMRLRVGDPLILFNGQGGEYQGQITKADKKRIEVVLNQFCDEKPKPLLRLHLFQGIARGEKMDWITQKSVELGVTSITPVITRYGNVRLSAEQSDKKIKHWQSTAIHACEQCGRNDIPSIQNPIDLIKQLPSIEEHQFGFILHPEKKRTISLKESLQDFQAEFILRDVFILIGAEGGFHADEIARATQLGWHCITLGKRILRTETAALAMLSAFQALFGDF